ncbi:MAG TPA: hypothetical protein VJ521_10665, partial [Acidobacteriota bacterium]|nr:hypothetical protein [Acidobacteriota bacterium]
MPREFVSLSLHRFLSSAKPLPASEAVPIFIDLLYELEEDHKKGQPHGGIYPDQIVLDTKSGPRLLRLTEARNIDELTPSYLCFVPPERLEGQAVSPQTDLFSMGVVLYALLTGHLPFEAKGKETLLTEIRNASIQDVPAFAGSHEIDWMIRRCLVEVPGRRFASAHEMMALLKKWMAASGLKPKVSATMPAHQLKRLVRAASRKNLVSRKTVYLLALLILMTIVGLAVYFLYPSKQRRADFAQWQQFSVPSEPYLEQDPTMSPDGSQIAFVSDKAANWELYVKNKKELEAIRLSHSPGFESNPRWSPLGDLILYGYVEPGTPPALYAGPPGG